MSNAVTSGSSVPELMSRAVAKHQAADLRGAAALYERLLSLDPNHPQALHNLGVIAHHQRRHEDAIALLAKAIRFEPNNPGYYYNLGNAYHALERFEEAAGQYRRAIELKRDYAAAHFNLGSSLGAINRFGEAAAAFREGIRLAPQIAEAHLGLADALARLGQLPEAEAEYRRVLSLKATLVPALNHLGRLLFEKGEPGAALVLAVRSLNAGDNDEGKALFIDAARYCSRAGEIRKSVDGLVPLLARAIRQHWVRPQDVMVLAGQALALDPAIGPCIARAGQAWPKRLAEVDLFGSGGISAAARNSLLTTLLESAPGSSRAMEKFVAAARATIIERLVSKEPVGDETLAFYASIANQAFVTEYVFSATDDEEARASAARDEFAAALARGNAIPALLLIAVAAYFPLIVIPGAEKLVQRRWPTSVQTLIDRQLREPLKEREIAPSIPALTPIENRVSKLVQEQYEENPYPRWIETTEAWGLPTHINEYLLDRMPLAPLRPPAKEKIDILIAGTGTGRQAVEIARQFPDARVLAVDLSRASLAYGKRKSEELGVKNIEYGLADIVEIGQLGRRFGVIFASGVLHHLAEPFAGWRALLGILEPNGLMNVGLYSERAREDIVAAQRFLADRGYKATAEDIRRARDEFDRLPADSPLRNIMLMADFFSLSDLRDALFHVQEHRMNLPQIAGFLAENGLTFLGFDQAPHIAQLYRERFPEDPAMTDLSLWDRFEQENPRAFIGMYQFWVQKAG